jgi:hypothetical protein
MIATIFIVLACLALVAAQNIPANLYTGYNKWLAVANSDEDCMYYAYDVQRLQSGFGYMFYNPFICNGGQVPNLVGCTGNLNFTTVRMFKFLSLVFH